MNSPKHTLQTRNTTFTGFGTNLRGHSSLNSDTQSFATHHNELQGAWAEQRIQEMRQTISPPSRNNKAIDFNTLHTNGQTQQVEFESKSMFSTFCLRTTGIVVVMGIVSTVAALLAYFVVFK